MICIESLLVHCGYILSSLMYTVYDVLQMQIPDSRNQFREHAADEARR